MSPGPNTHMSPAGHMSPSHRQGSHQPRQMMMTQGPQGQMQMMVQAPIRHNMMQQQSPVHPGMSPSHSVNYGSPGPQHSQPSGPMRRPSGSNVASPATDRPITPRTPHTPGSQGPLTPGSAGRVTPGSVGQPSPSPDPNSQNFPQGGGNPNHPMMPYALPGIAISGWGKPFGLKGGNTRGGWKKFYWSERWHERRLGVFYWS